MSYLFNNEVEITKPMSQFSELETVQRTPVVEVIPIKGITALRDITRTTGSGTITDAFSEIQLSTGTTANSVTELDTAERGRYLAGYGGNVGIGIRVPVSDPDLAGTAYREWGYAKRIDGELTNALLFTDEADGLHVKVYRDGVLIHDRQKANFNIDPLDGTGPSNIEWNVVNGTIFQIDFTWYGYGGIIWSIIWTDPATLRQMRVPVHFFRPENSTSLRIPNLPVHAYVSNGDQTTDYNMYVGGRQFSIIGPFKPIFRLVSEHVYDKGTDGTLRPIVSFKSKNTQQDLAISKKIGGFDISALAEDIYVEVRINAEVSNTAAFQVPGNHSNNEVSIVTDTTANTVTGGTPIWSGHIQASGGGGNIDAQGSLDRDGLFIDVPEDQICTVLTRTESGAVGNATITLRVREEY